MHRLIITLMIILSCPSTAEITQGEKLANAIIARYQPTIDVATQHGWDHSNSVVMHGMEKIYHNTGNPAYLAYIKRYADTFIMDNGRIEGLRSTLDGLHPGVITLFLYEQTGEKKYLLAAKQMRDHLLKGSTFQKTPDGAYWHKNVAKYNNVATVDGLYMVYPFLLRYALLSKDKHALDTALEQILLVSERSFNIKYKLPFHAWHYDKLKPWSHPITGTSSQFWSRASGWYSMALIDVLEHLPKSDKRYQKVSFLFQSLAQGLRDTQHSSGFWYQVLDLPNRQGNYPESSATGMIAYSLHKGVELGILDKSYAATATKGWLALLSKVSTYEDGGPQIHSVAPGMGAQNSYDAYVAIRPVSVPSKKRKQHMHGYMAFLMASSQLEK